MDMMERKNKKLMNIKYVNKKCNNIKSLLKSHNLQFMNLFGKHLIRNQKNNKNNKKKK